MHDQYEEPFIVDSSRDQATFAEGSTPLDDGTSATVIRYREQLVENTA